MRTLTGAFVLLVFLAGCSRTERADVATVTADMDAHMNSLVRLEGRRVKRNQSISFVSTGTGDFFVLEDESGRIRIWYDTVRLRCPPRLGAQIAVEGKVVTMPPGKRLLFVAKSISVEQEPPLADNEVRLCQLSRAESEIYWTEGPEQLLEHWRKKGMSERVIVSD